MWGLGVVPPRPRLWVPSGRAPLLLRGQGKDSQHRSQPSGWAVSRGDVRAAGAETVFETQGLPRESFPPGSELRLGPQILYTMLSCTLPFGNFPCELNYLPPPLARVHTRSMSQPTTHGTNSHPRQVSGLPRMTKTRLSARNRPCTSNESSQRHRRQTSSMQEGGTKYQVLA